MSTLRYHVVPQDIQCADCHGVVRRMESPAPTLDVSLDGIWSPGRCQECGNTGLILFPIKDARPIPEEPPK